MAVVRNPLEWGLDQVKLTNEAVVSTAHSASLSEENMSAPLPAVRRIGLADLKDALGRGIEDFAAYRSDVVFLCVIYPVMGILLARIAMGQEMLPLLFPIIAGFALVGPIAGIGLYEMSRRRELGGKVGLSDAFRVVRSPSFAGVVALSLLLVAIYVIWLFAAGIVYQLTLGPERATSLANFAREVMTTPAGWAMIVLGCGVGFLFAAFVLAISVVSFPLLLDREASVYTAVATSLRATVVNPVPVALWGLIVAAGLLVGSVPLLLGLIIVMPVLGHATWHLYRRMVAR